MAYNKTNWQSLPSTDTPISVGNLNKMENGIYDNSLKADQVGDLTQLETTEKSTLVGAINEVISNNNYSTTEINTGNTWIDDKPIYRKVVNITTASSNITSWTNLFEIQNVDSLINVYGYLLHLSNKTPVPRYEDSNYWMQFLYRNNYLMYRFVGFTSTNGYIVVEYTKTTD